VWAVIDLAAIDGAHFLCWAMLSLIGKLLLFLRVSAAWHCPETTHRY